MEKYISPNRIICEEKTENSYRLLRNKTLQAGFNNDECTKITTNGYVVLDFGKELSGGAVLCIQDVSCAPHTAKCRLVFGESVMETLSTLGEKNATNNHSIRDAVIDVTTMSTTKFGATGFRFLKIEAMDSDIVLKSVMAETDIIEFEYKGSFECSNELLNRIWKMGAYTVQLNIHEYVWDGVKRDRLVWVGDMHPEVAVIKTVFGRIEAVEKSLDFVKDETSPDSWMNYMPAYSMWWIIIHYEWYMYVGDIDYLRKQEEYLTVLTNNSMKWIDEDFYTNGGYFVDWSSAQTPAAADGIRSMFCMGLDAASKIFRILGNYERSEECRKYVKKLRTESYTADLNMSMAGINVLSGRNTKSARKILAESGTNGMSCFMGYYTLQAMASMGLCNEALYLMKEYWGGMIKMGATTFWEDFDIKWMENSGRIDEIVPDGMNDIHGDFGRHCYKQFRRSLCHGWAGGPTAFLTEYILGVRVYEAGCKKIMVAPNLCGMKNVSGIFPTPFGNVKIEHENKNGRVVSRIDAPKEIEILTKEKGAEKYG